MMAAPTPCNVLTDNPPIKEQMVMYTNMFFFPYRGPK